MLQKYEAQLYFVFRVLVGLLFAQHGAQKLLGWFTDKAPQALFSLMGLAGTIELVGGLLLALGLFTKWTAIIAAVEMLFAYFKSHAPSGLIPIMNRGELALLFFAAFLVLATQGAKKWSIDSKLKK